MSFESLQVQQNQFWVIKNTTNNFAIHMKYVTSKKIYLTNLHHFPAIPCSKFYFP